MQTWLQTQWDAGLAHHKITQRDAAVTSIVEPMQNQSKIAGHLAQRSNTHGQTGSNLRITIA
eukprot:8102177-Lingulodinium_polyedra.AAC.1